MNALLSALTGLVVAAATRLSNGAPLIYVEHFGHVLNRVDQDEQCTCDVDPDQPILTARLMDDDEMYAFGQIVGRQFSTDHEAVTDACREAMAQLAFEEAAYRLEDGDQ